ncbi:hypothetical protein L1987_65835 [Smallanthus sonchifolius]|uniref:Uncharacterized protein n=1 Tax=Smallanthus sonchifolius TaxID=185202 RepID=A0ACB9BVT1_9ASTR|nr:hypothetical protein L1987_65835 [Smallanthus sonchifolius]
MMRSRLMFPFYQSLVFYLWINVMFFQALTSEAGSISMLYDTCYECYRAAGDSNKTKLIHFGWTVNKVFDKLKSVRNILFMGIKGDSSDGSILEWVKVLDPRGVICVLERASSDVPRRLLSLDVSIRTKKKIMRASDIKIIMEKCRSKGEFSNLLGNNLKSDEIKVVFESASRRPLDFVTVYTRLLHGTNMVVHLKLFLAEDDRKVWINLGKSYVNTPSLAKLVDDTSKDFKLK